jgi:TetR/AcrR family transcriptional regulator, transcriptional repressor of aconitase
VPRVSESYLEGRRRQIMDAAITCFSREGFHRTTMQDIVAETGLSAGALYRYFPAKEDIVAAIAEEHHLQEASALANAGSDADLRTALHRIAEATLGRLTDPHEQRWRRVTVQVWGEALRDERIMEVVRAGLTEPVAIIAELVRQAQRAKTVPAELDPEAFARVCAAIFQGLVLQQAWDPELDVEACIDAAMALVDGLVGPGRTVSLD